MDIRGFWVRGFGFRGLIFTHEFSGSDTQNTAGLGWIFNLIPRSLTGTRKIQLSAVRWLAWRVGGGIGSSVCQGEQSRRHGQRRFDRNGAGARCSGMGATLGPRPSVCCRSGCMAFGRWAQCMAACVFFLILGPYWCCRWSLGSWARGCQL